MEKLRQSATNEDNKRKFSKLKNKIVERINSVKIVKHILDKKDKEEEKEEEKEENKEEEKEEEKEENKEEEKANDDSSQNILDGLKSEASTIILDKSDINNENNNIKNINENNEINKTTYNEGKRNMFLEKIKTGNDLIRTEKKNHTYKDINRIKEEIIDDDKGKKNN